MHKSPPLQRMVFRGSMGFLTEYDAGGTAMSSPGTSTVITRKRGREEAFQASPPASNTRRRRNIGDLIVTWNMQGQSSSLTDMKIPRLRK